MDISVVVPVYGCRAALHELHRRLVESVSTITDDFEIILVIGWSAKRPHYSREYNRKLPINDIDNRYQYVLYFLLSIE